MKGRRVLDKIGMATVEEKYKAVKKFIQRRYRIQLSELEEEFIKNTLERINGPNLKLDTFTAVDPLTETYRLWLLEIGMKPLEILPPGDYFPDALILQMEVRRRRNQYLSNQKE